MKITAIHYENESISIIPHTSETLGYWLKFGIGESILKRFQVVNVKSFSFISKDGQFQRIHATNDDPIFAFLMKDGAKIYRPLTKNRKYRFRYIGKKPSYNFVFGENQLASKGKFLILASGEKDVMTLHSMGFPAIAPNSESSHNNITSDLIKNLKRRFPKVVIIFDRDETGIRQSEILAEKHRLHNLVLPEIGIGKDISDYVENGFSKEELHNLLEEKIKELPVGFDLSEHFTNPSKSDEISSVNKSFNKVDSSSNQLYDEQTYKDVEYCVKQIEKEETDITVGYDIWTSISFALASLGERGRDFFLRISQFNPEYQKNECIDKFDNCLKDYNGSIKIGTFFHYYKEAGFTLPKSVGTNSKNDDNLVHVKTPMIPEEVYSNLPSILKDGVSLFSGRNRDVFLINSITILTGCFSRVFGIYDNDTVYPNLYAFTLAPPASGKKVLQLSAYLVSKIKDLIQYEYDQKMEQYKSDLESWKETKEGEKPKEPKLEMLFLPPNISSTGAVEIMSSNISNILVAPEADTLSQSLSKEWGNWSDLLRNAFHHEPYELFRITDNKKRVIRVPKLTVAISGTPDQLPNLIPSDKNGLFSRFIYYYYSDTSPFRNPFINKKDIREDLEPIALEILKIYKNLREKQKVKFQFTQQQEERFFELYDEWHQEIEAILGNGNDSVIFRLGLIFFRITMVLSILRNPNDNPIVCKDVDFDLTIEIIKVLKHHSIAVLDLLPEDDGTNGKRIANVEFYNQLPESFKTKEVVEMGKQIKLSRRTVYRLLDNYQKEGLITKVKLGLYEKVKNDTDDTTDIQH